MTANSGNEARARRHSRFPLFRMHRRTVYLFCSVVLKILKWTIEVEYLKRVTSVLDEETVCNK